MVAVVLAAVRLGQLAGRRSAKYRLTGGAAWVHRAAAALAAAALLLVLFQLQVRADAWSSTACSCSGGVGREGKSTLLRVTSETRSHLAAAESWNGARKPGRLLGQKADLFVFAMPAGVPGEAPEPCSIC